LTQTDQESSVDFFYIRGTDKKNGFEPPPSEMVKKTIDYFVGQESTSRSNLKKEPEKETNCFTAVGMQILTPDTSIDLDQSVLKTNI
jgi:hypothetical protein